MSDRPRRDLLWAGAVWVILVVLGEFWVMNMSFMPNAASEQAIEVDGAMDYLFIYSVPVLAFVLTVLGYAVFRWRVSEPSPPESDIGDHAGFSWGWLIVSTLLAALLFSFPGLTGLLALAETPEPDLVVEIEGVQWHWDVAFPDRGVSIENPDEILLPVDTVIRFDVTSRDVIHSFWVPSFRMKQDAIPGEVNSVYVTTSETGSFDQDSNMRLQCAELCGTGHARMFVGVRVVEPAEFETWIIEQGGTGGGMDMGDEDGMDMGDEG